MQWLGAQIQRGEEPNLAAGALFEEGEAQSNMGGAQSACLKPDLRMEELNPTVYSSI
uniref:Uncharacterized protein n=1 Tax=Arundo donax TaxID=35708 RepID=A0A0A8Z4K0_ARUDO